MAQDYSRLLDPASGELATSPDIDARLERDLLWLRSELKLSPEQFVQLKSLHEDSNDRLQLLALELARARTTEAHWEAEQKTTGDVDFLSYGFAVRGVDALKQMSTQATRGLVDSTAAILNNQQRRHYLRLLGATGSASGGGGS